MLLRPDLPHFWRSDAPPEHPRPDGARAVCVQFAEGFAGGGLFELPEFAGVGELLRQAGRGLCFVGEAARPVVERLARLPELDGAERLLALLGVLHALVGIADGARPLTSAGFAPVLNLEDARRLNRVLDYVNRHLTGEVTQPAAARAASLSAVGFSRFFRRKTGRTFTVFVNALRVGHAARLLLEGRGAASRRCALRAGFRTCRTSTGSSGR